MGLFGTSTPTRPATPPPDAPSITAPVELPKPGAGLPPAHKMTAEQQGKLQGLIATLSAPDYALPAQSKDLKAFWKLRAKLQLQGASASSGSSTPATSPVSDRRQATDVSVASAAGDQMALQPLADQEKFWLSTEQLQRCLRATKWDAKKGLERAEETVVWRREYGTDALTAKDVWVENETGKQYIYGYDKESRPIHYMHPDRQNTKTSPEQIKHVVYQLERTVDLMPPGVENLCLCIDFGASHGGGQPTSVGQARTVLHILQTYYCERLGRAVCANVPAVFTAFYSILRPFIDPVTKDKIRFVKDISEVHALIDVEYLTTTDFGAKENRYYNKHEQYFTALEEVCKARRAANFERWQRLCGGRVGASEFVYKSGQRPDAGAPVVAAEEEQPEPDRFPDEHEPTVITPFADAPKAAYFDVERARPDDAAGLEAGVEALQVGRQ